jgi:GST-like protein
MIKFYFNLSPNPMKVALALEEMGLPYEPIAVDTRKGDQFAPDFLAVNPNGKVPAIADGDNTVFDSNAILLYLAEKAGQFGPEPGAKSRGEFLSWLMFVATGVGPFSGQAVHFKHFAPERVAYADTRYQYEADRHYTIVDQRLADRPYLAGDIYSVADMALWGWARMVPFILGDDAWTKFPNLKRLLDEISARPAAQRVEDLRTRQAGSFKAQMDDDARAVMFKHVRAA